MIEAFEPQAVTAAPTTEIACWLAKLQRADFALAEHYRITTGGDWGDDTDQTIWCLAEESLKGKEYKADPEFDDVVIYQLKKGITYNRIAKILDQTDEAAVRTKSEKIAQRGRAIGRAALHEGLIRLGLIDVHRPGAIPPAAMAALCFRRGDIRQSVDRALFTRHEEIEADLGCITTEAPPRTAQYRLQLRQGEQASKVRGSVYYLAVIGSKSLVEKLGLTASEGQNGAWWQELRNDLARIDLASDNL